MRYCQVVSFLPASYATDDVIADVETEVTNFKQLKSVSAVRYSEMLSEKALRYVRSSISHG